jgi:hypothetical protein
MGLTCAGCRTTAEQSDGHWAAVLKDEPGSVPEVVCPRCAEQICKGLEIDPQTGERSIRDFASTISYF